MSSIARSPGLLLSPGMVMMVTVRKVAVPEIMLKMVRRV